MATTRWGLAALQRKRRWHCRWVKDNSSRSRIIQLQPSRAPLGSSRWITGLVMPAEAGRSRQRRLRISGGGLNSAGFPTWRCNGRAEMHRGMASRMDPSPTVWTAPPFLGGHRGFETFCSGSLAAAHACLGWGPIISLFCRDWSRTLLCAGCVRGIHG